MAILVGISTIVIAVYSFGVYSSAANITGFSNNGQSKAENASQVSALNTGGNGTTFDNNPSEMQISSHNMNKSEDSLKYAVFTVGADEEAKEIISDHLSMERNQSNYIVQSIRTLAKTTWWFDEFPDERKMILIQSWDNVTSAIQLAKRYNNTDLIVYDIEHWSRTPKAERATPVFSMMKLADIVHEAGLKYGLAPDAEYLHNHYKSITWSKIDFVDMQLQRYSSDPERFVNYTKVIGSFIKSKNPEIDLYVQISLGRTDHREASKLVESVGNIVDGIFLAYIPESNLAADKYASKDHAEAALDKVLNEIETFSGTS